MSRKIMLPPFMGPTPSGADEPVNWFEALKGPFKGKGREWVKQIEAELEEIHGQMKRLHVMTLKVEDRRVYLELHKRAAKLQIAGLALRWRLHGPGTYHAHVLWPKVVPIVERMPAATRDWYGHLQHQANWLNAREVALAYERKVAKLYLETLNVREEDDQ